MPNKVPYITAALICEKVLQEKDNVLTAVRIVDTLFVEGSSQVAGVVPAIQLTVLLMLKSGDITGSSEISLKFRSPSGKVTDAPEKYPSILTGGVQGQNLALTFLMALKESEFGLCWIDVYWNGEPLTSIPFNLAERPAVETPEKT